MTHRDVEQLERELLAERARLEREIAQLTTPPADVEGDRGRFGDDETAGAAGSSPEVDGWLAAHAARELDDVDRALTQLLEDPDHFGRCATCGRPVPIERLRLVPGTRYCSAHAPQ